jgi:hypothetical protein
MKIFLLYIIYQYRYCTIHCQKNISVFHKVGATFVIKFQWNAFSNNKTTQ